MEKFLKLLKSDKELTELKEQYEKNSEIPLSVTIMMSFRP